MVIPAAVDEAQAFRRFRGSPKTPRRQLGMCASDN
jgi:hypothetical protein